MGLIDMDWKTRTRTLVGAHQNTWNPCICIQGGGAKGAWEAGVLSGLLNNRSTANPVAVFGTSAGALNAMWASTMPWENGTRKLLDNWHHLAMLVSATVIFVPAFLFSLLIGVIVYSGSPSVLVFGASFILAFTLWASLTVLMLETFSGWGLIYAGIFSCCTAAIVLFALGHQWVALLPLLPLLLCALALADVWVLCFFVRWWAPWGRLPGIFSIPWLSRRLPLPEVPARFPVYMCTANVNLNEVPVEWDWNTLGVFRLERGQTSPNLITQPPDVRYDLRTAAMCSAALPMLCRPYAVGNRQFLDGGMEANLPAGFIRSQGLLGGRCVICIIPHPVELLDPHEHVQYRTVRFLYDIQQEQASHRARLAGTPPGVATTAPGHTNYPVLIVSPRQELESGLMNGFLRPHILPGEFDAGLEAASNLTHAMEAFLDGDANALDPYLLDHRQLPTLPPTVPRPECWALWTNPRWLQ